MKKRSILLLIAASLVAVPAVAKTAAAKPVTPAPLFANWSPVITLSAGADFVRRGQQQSLTLLPPFQNYYTAQQGYHALADGGLFLGLEHKIGNKMAAQLGVSAYLTSAGSLSGDVWQLGSAAFDNLTYSYQVHNERLMLSSKFLYLVPDFFSPYVTAEMGVAFNRAYNYQETPLIPQVVAIPYFRSANRTAFSWALGLGADYPLTSHLRLGAGYQFADLGAVSLGTSPAQATRQTLQISHLYAHQARLQLTYVF